MKIQDFADKYDIDVKIISVAMKKYANISPKMRNDYDEQTIARATCSELHDIYVKLKECEQETQAKMIRLELVGRFNVLTKEN